MYISCFSAWTNMRISKELEERQRFDELQFQRAGRGPVQKTYKYDPTQPRKVSNIGKDAIAAKKRDR
jgi:YidC/Oxa1 family membrane protein insertase